MVLRIEGSDWANDDFPMAGIFSSGCGYLLFRNGADRRRYFVELGTRNDGHVT